MRITRSFHQKWLIFAIFFLVLQLYIPLGYHYYFKYHNTMINDGNALHERAMRTGKSELARVRKTQNWQDSELNSCHIITVNAIQRAEIEATEFEETLLDCFANDVEDTIDERAHKARNEHLFFLLFLSIAPYAGVWIINEVNKLIPADEEDSAEKKIEEVLRGKK